MRVWASLLCCIGHNHLILTFKAIDSLFLCIYLTVILLLRLQTQHLSLCCPLPRTPLALLHTHSSCLPVPQAFPGAACELLTVLDGMSRISTSLPIVSSGTVCLHPSPGSCPYPGMQEIAPTICFITLSSASVHLSWTFWMLL